MTLRARAQQLAAGLKAGRECTIGRKPLELGKGRYGANRDRTGDLLLAKQALSQLSYGPVPLSLPAVD